MEACPLHLIPTSISCSEWKPISGKKIGTSSFNSRQIVVAVGSDVHYLDIKDGELKETRCVRTCVRVCAGTCVWGGGGGAGVYVTLHVCRHNLGTFHPPHSYMHKSWWSQVCYFVLFYWLVLLLSVM